MGVEATMRTADGGSRARATRGLGACLAATVLSFAFGWSAPAANAAHVSCGETITADTTLDSDLTKCKGNGIVIGADDITLDLNGHTITGKGKWAGVNNDAGHDGVTIEGGAIRRFADSVRILNASDNIVRGLTMSDDSHVGIYVQDTLGTQIEENSVTHNRFAGIFVFRSPDARIADNFVSGNLGGILAPRSDHLVIEGNISESNGDGAGIDVAESSGSYVSANTASDNEWAGIVLESVDTTQVSENQVSGNSENIIIIGNENTVENNQVVDAGDAGNCRKCGFGISVDAGAGNLIAGNDVSRSLLGGIRIDAFEPGIPTADNVIRDNVVHDAGVDGISVGTDGPGSISGTLIESNRATGSGDDGFDIGRPATTLTANNADDNFDLGIGAVPGVIDGGGNTASGNGNPLQCTNVFCG